MQNSKARIQTLTKNFELLLEILSFLPISIKNQRDLTNTSVWGVLNGKDKESLKNLLNLYKESKISKEVKGKESLSPEAKKELKIIGIKLIRLIDSLGTYKKRDIEMGENNKLRSKMKNYGVALEYFLIDILNRLENGKGYQVEKGPEELDGKKVDFIFTINKKIKLGIQLTSANNISKKRKELEENRNSYDIGNPKNNQEISIRSIPDCPVLIIIKDKKIIPYIRENGLFNAFEKWVESGFPIGGPSKFLPKNIENELEIMGSELPEIINKSLNLIKTKFKPGIKIEFKSGNIEYKFIDNRLQISIYDKNNPNLFIYSIEFFITNTLLKKLRN